MNIAHELAPLLKKIGLSSVLQAWETRCHQGSEQNLSLSEFLNYVLHDEVERRDGEQLDLRTRRAGFEDERSLEDFDFNFNSSIPRAPLLGRGSCA